MSTNKNTFKPNFEVNSPSDFKAALETLNDNISSITKQISYLDIYNIVEAITNKDTFEAQVASLAPNSSLVVNTDPFYINSELYNTGDLILKLVDERVIHIKAQSGGLYFPSQIIKNENNYSLQYTYSPTRPLDGSNKQVGISENKEDLTNTVSLPQEQITFTGLTTGNQSENYIYGIWSQYGDSEIFEFEKCTWKNNSIKPLIKFYLVDNSNNKVLDEIVLDYKLEEIGSNWRVTIDLVNTSLWIKVK